MEKRNHFASKNLFLLFLILVFACGFAIVYYNLSDSLDYNNKHITQAADDNPWTDYTESFRGSGTSDDPYIIASAENLAYLASRVARAGGSRLFADFYVDFIIQNIISSIKKLHTSGFAYKAERLF